MRQFIKIIFILVFILSGWNITNAQFECGYIPDTISVNFSTNPFQGFIRPNRTDTINGSALPSSAFFPVLIVFVQFNNHLNDPRNSWPMDSAPVYINNLIATQKKTTGDWWDYYNENTEIFSDHWMEISRGKLHIISPAGAFSVVLAFEKSHYDSLPGYISERVINAEMLDSVKAHGLINWQNYDKWTYNLSTGEFSYGSDGIVDMIYKVVKSRNSGIASDGFASLASYGNNFYYRVTVDPINSIDVDYTASGVTTSFRGQLSQYIGTLGHEHGHLMFSNGHSTYSRVSYGFGYDFFYSPADMILNGYMTPANATINATNGLGDFSSRNSGSGNLLKIPVQGNEYFLLASRNKISKWDRVMSGDVAQIDPYGDVSEYGKGLYIYHIPDGIIFPTSDISQQDMECADGLFDFDYEGQSAQQVVHDCFISGSNDWYYYSKKKVLYENDSSNLYLSPPSGYTFRFSGDGISARDYIGIINNEHAFRLKWWGEGEQPANPCNIGTDRLFTNNEEAYTRFDIGGDRYDPWKPGYNEVFSPYSSPNTNTWSNDSSGIFIWYYNYTGSTPPDIAYIKIYKSGTGGFSEDSILHLTPPSRPMGLRVMPCDSLSVIDGYRRIKIRWNHNMEPDMRNMITGWQSYSKAYKIYRSVAEDMDHIPPDAQQFPEQYYEEITVVNIDEADVPEYTDYYSLSPCNLFSNNCPPYCPYPLRYRVSAVDKYEDESVLSDFVNTTAIGTGEDEGSDNLLTSNDENIPKEYSLKQNYPNPFNPSTNIQYDLPEDNFVRIKIYDILGKEVFTLVNEFKEAGRYVVSFNGSNLPSGVYFYRIKSGGFENVKRLVLIK